MAQILYPSRITKIRFNISGTEDIRRESFVPVNSFDLMKGGKPYPGGVYDGHLGTTDHTYNCQTCFNNKKNCLGHDGHLNLNYPIQSPMAFSEMKKWLRLICFKCGNPILDEPEYMQFPKSKRLDEASKAARASVRNCPTCGTPHPIITKDKEKPLMIIAEERDERKKTKTSFKLYPHMIWVILDRISDATVINMGKKPESHPRKFILGALKIPPITIRPDIKRIGSGRSSNNDLTTLLQNIIRDNDKIPPVIPDEIDQKLEANIYALNDLVYAYIRGSHGKKPITGGNMPTHSLALRLRGKQGLHRKHQQGKRVRVVARSTITGDPSLKINQLGMPLKFAKILQVEETVQEYNKKKLMVNYMNGRAKYPGCTKIIKKNTGTEYSIDTIQSNLELEIGDKILRDIETGDYVLFGRQPSLLPSSISAHEVIVAMDPDVLTLRMNVDVCSLYNADFDGDQMNVYVVSSIAGRNEIEQLGEVSNWFIKHSYASPLIGQADDSIIGLFCMTRAKVKLDKYHAMQLFSGSTYIPKFEKETYTGRDIMSMILEETPVNFTRDPGYYNKDFAAYIDYDPSEIKVNIERGVHKSGVIDKKSIGKGAVGGLYHIISIEYGPERAIESIYNMQQLAHNYMYMHGFTIGIMDIIVSKDVLKKVHEIGASIMNKAKLITEQLNNGEIVPPVGKTVEEYYEELQIATLRVVDDFIDPIFQSIDTETNNLLQLVLSGSKGTINHVFHIASAIGQIVINGKRPPKKFAYNRTLPHFPRYETDPEAHGFILNSYISGMTSVEAAFNAQNARFDMISKALSTSVTGESNRKSIKNLESILVNNFHMCVKANNIIQLCYGEDGLDTRKIIRVKIPTIMISDDELAKGWKYESKNPIFAEEFQAIVDDRKKYRETFLNLEAINVNELMTDERFVAIDIKRVVGDVIYKFGEQKPSEAEIIEMVHSVRRLCKGIPYTLINEIQENLGTPVPDYIQSATWMLCVLIRAELNSKRTLSKINKEMLDLVINKIRAKQAEAMADYGTAVGIIAAQAFSEPLTQYMLDAHHRTVAGGTSKSVMVSVKEVLGAKPTEKLSAASMTLLLRPEYNTEAKAQEIANYIETMKFIDFVSIAQIFFEKFGEPIHPKYKDEKGMIAEFQKNNPLLKPPSDLIKWCMRFVLNRSKMIYKNMNIMTIIIKLRDLFPDLYIIHSPENSKQAVIRVYIRNVYFKEQVEQGSIEELRDKMLHTIIRGVSGINMAVVSKLKRNEIKADGSIGPAENVFAIKTVGTNVSDIMKIAPIDLHGIQTDAIEETQNIYGIEAAHQRLVSSIRNLGAGGLNYHHVSIYADEMTFTGRVTSIEKQGLGIREANNVLLRMGFSAPIQTLEEAGINAMEDPVQGLTAPLLKGDAPILGTAFNEFHINENMVKSNTTRPDDWLDDLSF